MATIDDERAVLGDELMQRGDPQGELIGLMVALDALPAGTPGARRGVIERKIAALLDQHHDALYGALAPHVTRASRPDLFDPALIVKEWRGGFADTIWIQRRFADVELVDIVRAMRELPIARFVRRLLVGVGDHAPALAELGRDPPASLRELVIGDQTHALPKLPATPFDDLAAAASLLAHVERCEIQVATESAPFTSSTLQRFTMFRSWSYFEPMTARFEPRLDAIEELTLAGFLYERGFLVRFPRLRRAQLTGTFERGWLEQWLQMDLDTRLELDLFGSSMHLPELEVLVRNAQRIEKLARLGISISTTFPERAAREALIAQLPPNVRVI